MVDVDSNEVRATEMQLGPKLRGKWKLCRWGLLLYKAFYLRFRLRFQALADGTLILRLFLEVVVITILVTLTV